MTKLRCLITVPDKYTGEQYKMGTIYEFEDDRAKEILEARTIVTNEPFFELVKDVINEAENTDKNVENVEVVEEKPKRKRKTKKD